MEEFSWPSLEDRRNMKIAIHTLEKILTHDLEVDYKLFTLVNSGHNARRENTRHTIDTDAMKYFMQWNFITTCSHSFSILSLILCHLF